MTQRAILVYKLMCFPLEGVIWLIYGISVLWASIIPLVGFSDIVIRKLQQFQRLAWIRLNTAVAISRPTADTSIQHVIDIVTTVWMAVTQCETLSISKYRIIFQRNMTVGSCKSPCLRIWSGLSRTNIDFHESRDFCHTVSTATRNSLSERWCSLIYIPVVVL